MFPHNNNYYSYQGLPNSSNYTFDLKVNVDFSKKSVNLGVPTPPPHFTKTPQIPVIYPDPAKVASPAQYLSRQGVPYPQNQPIIHQVQPMWQPLPAYYIQTQPSYNSVYSPRHIDQSIAMRSKHNPKSSNDTYPNTSFSMGIEKSVDDIECVICDKKVNRGNFSNHLQQHKTRKKDYARNQYYACQTEKIGSVSGKNQNSIDNLGSYYRQIPSRVSQNTKTVEMNLSQLQQSKTNSLSRPIEDTHSRIVYAPRDMFQKNNGASHLQSASMNSFGINKQSLANQSRQNSKVGQPINGGQRNNYMSVQQRGYQANQNSSRISKVSSMKVLNSDAMRKDDSRSLSQKRQPYQYYFQQNSRGNSSRNSKPKNNLNLSSSNYMNFDGNSSRMVPVGQKKKQPSFSDIQQSIIHRINDNSRDYSILQLKKELNIQQIQEQSSSDDQGPYLSVHAQPTKIYQSVGVSKYSAGMTSSSNKTDKLTRTKLPVNYLARQQFIVNTMLTRSCYKSKHSNWK